MTCNKLFVSLMFTLWHNAFLLFSFQTKKTGGWPAGRRGLTFDLGTERQHAPCTTTISPRRPTASSTWIATSSRPTTASPASSRSGLASPLTMLLFIVVTCRHNYIAIIIVIAVVVFLLLGFRGILSRDFTDVASVESRRIADDEDK